MLSRMQVLHLAGLSLALWGLATLSIRLLPGAFVDPVEGSIGFITTVPVAWFSVRLVKIVGRLSSDRLLAGVAVVGAVAMMIDGVALRWFAGVYGPDSLAARLGAAWLLWGYGVSLAVALAMTWKAQSASAEP